MRLVRIALLAALAPLGGCMTGLIYTHTVLPLTTNFNRTPIVEGKLETGESDVKDLRIPWPVSVDIRWHLNAIGETAKREGIEEIYYADIEHLGVFFNIWRQDFVHVYGKAAAQPPANPPANPPPN